MAVNRDPQGNLLVAARNGIAVSLSRYTPQGQLLQTITDAGRTLNAGGIPAVLACDSQGMVYLASGNAIARPTGSAGWTPTLPAGQLEIDAIGFDPQNNPILAIEIIDPPNTDGRLLKLDRATGQMLANLDMGAGVTATAISVDSSGAVYATGLQYLTGFAAKFDALLQKQLYFTSLDGAMPHGVAVDSSGTAFIVETPLGVPVTAGPPNGGVIHFGLNSIYKLDPSGAIAATAAGGGSAIAIDGSGNLIVVGGSYPPTGAFQVACGPRTDLGGLSVTVLNPATLQPKSSAFLAQQSFQSASSLLPDGTLYLATQANRVLHVSPAAPSSPVACIVNGASYLVESSIVPGQLLTIFGRGLGSDPITAYNDSAQLPFSSGDTDVRIQGIPAPLLAVSSGQINAIVPYGIGFLNPQIPAAVEIVRNGSVIYTWQLSPTLRNPAPLLRFNAAGTLDFFQAPAYQDVLSTYPVPLADVLNQDGSPNTATNPAQLGSTVTILATGLGPLDGTPLDGAPGGASPQWPADPILFKSAADIPIWTPSGNLTLPGPTPITTIPGHSNSLLQITATIPANFPSGPLPFFVGTLSASPVWTNFLYVK